jgi:uncharacterized phage protein (TIGR02218 family)
MPTFDEYEDSIDLGAPSEFFLFETQTEKWAYTSDDTTVQVLGSTFRPIPIRRGNIVTTNSEDAATLEVELPTLSDMVSAFAFSLAPPENLKLTVYRMHEGDSDSVQVYFQGTVASIKISGNMAKLSIPSTLTQAVSANIPSAHYQTQCNHSLFDTRCQLLRDAFLYADVVFSVSNDEIALTTPLGGVDNDFFAGGEVIGRTSGERRLITSSTSDRLGIAYPFRLLAPGDSIDFYPGCDHSVATCKAKFNNVVNFGGFPFIPSKNPFKSGFK